MSAFDLPLLWAALEEERVGVGGGESAIVSHRGHRHWTGQVFYPLLFSFLIEHFAYLLLHVAELLVAPFACREAPFLDCSVQLLP